MQPDEVEQRVVMKDSDNYDALSQRTAHPTAWLDEVLQSIELAIQDAVNEQTIDGKNRVLLAMNSYIAGIMDGNRFMRESPYKNSQPLLREQLRRITHS